MVLGSRRSLTFWVGTNVLPQNVFSQTRRRSSGFASAARHFLALTRRTLPHHWGERARFRRIPRATPERQLLDLSPKF